MYTDWLTACHAMPCHVMPISKWWFGFLPAGAFSVSTTKRKITYLSAISS